VPIKLSPTAPALFAPFIYLIEVLIQPVKRVWVETATECRQN